MNENLDERVEPLEYGQAREAKRNASQWSPVFIVALLIVAAIFVGLVMLPTIRSRRPTRTWCAANLRGIAQAMYVYDDGGRGFPPSFQALVDELNAVPKQFECPVAKSAPGNLNADYVYIPGQSGKSDPGNVLVYERRGNHRPDDIANVLFVDGHVETVIGYAKVLKLVRETEARLATTSGPASTGEKPRVAR